MAEPGSKKGKEYTHPGMPSAPVKGKEYTHPGMPSAPVPPWAPGQQKNKYTSEKSPYPGTNTHTTGIFVCVCGGGRAQAYKALEEL